MLARESMPRCHFWLAPSLASKLTVSHVSSRASWRFFSGQTKSERHRRLTHRLSRYPWAGPASLAFAPGPTCFTGVARANVVCESLLLAELLRTHAASSTARPPSLGSSTAAYFTLQGQLKTVGSSATVSVLLSMLARRLRCDHTFLRWYKWEICHGRLLTSAPVEEVRRLVWKLPSFLGRIAWFR